MPPVWTDLATAAAQVRDGDLVALGGHTRAAPTGPDPGTHPPGPPPPGVDHRAHRGPQRRPGGGRLAITASRKVIATLEERVAGLQPPAPERHRLPLFKLQDLFPGQLIGQEIDPAGAHSPGGNHESPQKLLREKGTGQLQRASLATGPGGIFPSPGR